MLFGVPDEITDVTRVSGMVRKQRLIYRMTSFHYQKVFIITGNVPGVMNGFRVFTGRGHPPGSESNRPMGVWGAAPALSGLVGQPKRALCAKKKKSREKKKKEEVGRKGRTPSHQTKSNSVWGGEPSPLGLGRTPWGLLSPKERPLPSHLYIQRF